MWYAGALSHAVTLRNLSVVFSHCSCEGALHRAGGRGQRLLPGAREREEEGEEDQEEEMKRKDDVSLCIYMFVSVCVCEPF